MPELLSAQSGEKHAARTSAKAPPVAAIETAPEEQAALRDRMVETFTAVRVRRQDSPWLAERMGLVVEEARLFMRYPRIPLWPPAMLLRRIMRFFLAPAFAAQISFNEAVRDVLLDFQRRSETQAAAQEEALKTIAALELQLDELRERLETQTRAGGRP